MEYTEMICIYSYIIYTQFYTALYLYICIPREFWCETWAFCPVEFQGLGPSPHELVRAAPSLASPPASVIFAGVENEDISD